MEFFTVVGIILILYYLIQFVLLCIFDCDLTLAWFELFGKPLSKLEGKVVWITGASSGIGEAMAYEVARQGGRLVISARRRDELVRVQARCLEIHPSRRPNDVLLVPLDVTQHHTHQPCFDDVIRHFGQVDILINNAGRSQRAQWEEIDLQVDKDLFELNVFGVVNLTRLVMKHFNVRGEGTVAVTSSIAGIIGVPFSASYTGSKHAIHGYFEALRWEKMGTNISVTIICPGPVFSDFLKESFTANPGEKFGVSVNETDRRMSAARCAKLSLVAVVNQLDSAWIAVFPLIPIVYAFIYLPNLSRFIAKHIGIQRRIQNLRDTRVTVVKSNEATSTSSI